MILTLRAVSLDDRPLSQPITAHFDSQGGTIGRSDHNTLALPDPERHISRQQAEIVTSGDGYAIRNIGSANPIVVRGQPLVNGDTAALRAGDPVRIGGYLLEVVEEQPSSATTITRGRATVESFTPPAPLAASGLLGDLASPLASSNPFAEWIGGNGNPSSAAAMPPAPPAPLPPPAMRTPGRIPSTDPPPPAPKRPSLPKPAFDPFADLQPAPSGIPSASEAWLPSAQGRPNGGPKLPDDFDPFAPPLPQSAPRDRAQRSGGGAFGDLIPGTEPQSIDAVFGLQGNDARASVAAFLDGSAAAPGDGGSAVSTDPFALFGARPAAAPPGATLADDRSELRSAFVPPAVAAAPAPATVGTGATPPLPIADPAAGPLWAALCEGAGIDPRLAPNAPDAEAMRTVGRLLRAAVDGTLKLVAMRATTKHELRAQVTVIQSRNNNPLKFSPDVQQALEQLLAPPLRGFLSGPAAMTDAMNDLLGHAIGTMAGTRAALAGVLDRFAPAELEAKLGSRSPLDSLLPLHRKAKLWNLYLQHFEAIHAEAHDDFQALFGKAFVAAYEQQLERLQADPSAADC